mgnify:CR=1 FL=1
MVHFKEKARYNYDDLLEIIRVLRSPEGCPWDQVQTHQSIRRGLLEEAYEAYMKALADEKYDDVRRP